MPKLKNDAIDSIDLIEYLDTASDFGFELRCLERLSQLGFNCQHGGSYTDPVSGKTRQFDIRAQKENGRLRVGCAVECKSLSKSFPLLLSCVPRSTEESFHELVFAHNPAMNPGKSWNPLEMTPPAFRPLCKAFRTPPEMAGYAIGDPVGKSSVQVGRLATADNSVTANDAEVFEKWSQALASADDLANEAAMLGEWRKKAYLSLILPILVVPDGTLWQVDYSADGKRNSDPIKVDRCCYFVGHQIHIGDKLRGDTLTVSHLEFVTLSGLTHLLTNIVDGESWFCTLDGTSEPPD